MEPSHFTKDAPGKLIKAREGFWAFVPDPLAPKLDFDYKTVNLLSDADRALGELAGVGRILPNPHLLISPFLRREAVLSSRLEGTIATAEELLLFEALPTREPPRPDVREVYNYAAALEYGLRRLKELPVSLRFIREIHDRLLRGVRGEDHRPGEFRERQNFIGQPGQSANEARFVPPPENEMRQALDAFERFIHAPTDLPFLPWLALVHYQFETIHPFIDGNGRIGRLLIPILLCERKLLSQPLLYLSAYFERNREAYINHLFKVSCAGAWVDWIRFFLAATIEQSKDAIRRSQRLQDLWQQYRRTVQKARASALAVRLVDDLFAYPATTVVGAAERLGVSYPSAQLNIQRLVSAGILEERTGNRRNRLFIAQEIAKIIQAEEP